MVKRYLRMSPEMIEDLLAYSKDLTWCENVRSGKFKIRFDVDHDDGYVLEVPLKIDREPETGYITAEWEVTDEEDAFERLVFRQLRAK